jgi:hypothetical protein
MAYRKITVKLHHSLNDYELFFGSIKDTFGRTHKFCVFPKDSGGGPCYFDSLKQLHAWEREVIDIRRMQDGKLSIEELQFQIHMGYI